MIPRDQGPALTWSNCGQGCAACAGPRHGRPRAQAAAGRVEPMPANCTGSSGTGRTCTTGGRTRPRSTRCPAVSPRWTGTDVFYLRFDAYAPKGAAHRAHSRTVAGKVDNQCPVQPKLPRPEQVTGTLRSPDLHRVAAGTGANLQVAAGTGTPAPEAILPSSPSVSSSPTSAGPGKAGRRPIRLVSSQAHFNRHVTASDCSGSEVLMSGGPIGRHFLSHADPFAQHAQLGLIVAAHRDRPGQRRPRAAEGDRRAAARGRCAACHHSSKAGAGAGRPAARRQHRAGTAADGAVARGRGGARLRPEPGAGHLAL